MGDGNRGRCNLGRLTLSTPVYNSPLSPVTFPQDDERREGGDTVSPPFRNRGARGPPPPLHGGQGPAGVPAADHPANGEVPPLRQEGQACHEVRAVRIIPEDGVPLDPSHHHVVPDLGGIGAGLAGHGVGQPSAS